MIGSPSDDELGFIASDKAKRYIRSLPKNDRVNFHDMWPQANLLAIDLLDKMLVFHPSRRMSVRSRGTEGGMSP